MSAKNKKLKGSIEHKEQDVSFLVLPLRDIVVFPGTVMPLYIGREKSIITLREIIKENKRVVLVTQKNQNIPDPTYADLYSVGVLGNIVQCLMLPNGTMKILVEASKRVHIDSLDDEQLLTVTIEELQDEYGDELELDILEANVTEKFIQYTKINRKVNQEVLSAIGNITNLSSLSDIMMSHLFMPIEQKQDILETINVNKRLEKINAYLETELNLIEIEKNITGKVQEQMAQTQKEYLLKEKLKAIQDELAHADPASTKGEVSELEAKAAKVKFSKEAREKVNAEIKKLQMMPPMSSEASIVRNYVDWMLNIPWSVLSKTNYDTKHAAEILDRDHYGLEKVKERILEFIAVAKRTKKIKGPILCLVGPPGVGKTSLAKSIADATGRSYVRFALGGVRDEAEIRGHRKTYVGALPGKLMQLLKKAKTSNPVLLLDEVDKIGSDYRGDPAAALLEVLDPEQNSKFVDHFLEVEYDLSDVMFIATANSLNIPRPLLDRMEVIRVSGYTEDEKVQIAKRHLVPKQKTENGLEEKEWSITEEAIREIIRSYTRESGVRNIEREVAKLARKAVREISEKGLKSITVNAKNLSKYLGVKKYLIDEANQEDMVGITTGLAFTETGGEILMLEALSLPGKGNIKTTGKLGDVMQESAQAAFSFFRSHSKEYGIKTADYQKRDIHLHVPEGATPKDGPSAGVAMFTSVVSVMTGIPVKKTVAMTGEITLRGRVLAIGGLKEKLLAALRSGIKTVLIPLENTKDLTEIPQNVKKNLEIIPIKYANEALEYALSSMPKPLMCDEDDTNNTHAEENDA